MFSARSGTPEASALQVLYISPFALSRDRLFEAMIENRVKASRMTFIKACTTHGQNNGFGFLDFPICMLLISLQGIPCKTQHDGNFAGSMLHPAGHAAGWIQRIRRHDPLPWMLFQF